MNDRRRWPRPCGNSRNHVRRTARNSMRSHRRGHSHSDAHSTAMLCTCNNWKNQRETRNHPDSAHKAPSRGRYRARSPSLQYIHPTLKRCACGDIGFMCDLANHRLLSLSRAAPRPSLSQRVTRFSPAGGCAITVGPWNVPRKQGFLLFTLRVKGSNRRLVMISLHKLCPPRTTRARSQRAQVTSRSQRTKTFRGIVRFARSGSRPGAAS